MRLGLRALGLQAAAARGAGWLIQAAAVAAIALAVVAATGRLPWRPVSDPRPSPDIHYAPAEDLEALDVALVDSAGERIDMAAYVLTDAPLIAALTAAAERGVAVRIWRDNSTSGYGDAAGLARLAGTGAVMRVKPPGELMHLKSYCVDGQTLRTGAANFSASGEKRQDNDLVVIRGPAACAGFEANFARLWKEAAQ